ncbi:hypothetical protein ADUPG1_004502, partial [Aduncisulcus paluster]
MISPGRGSSTSTTQGSSSYIRPLGSPDGRRFAFVVRREIGQLTTTHPVDHPLVFAGMVGKRGVGDTLRQDSIGHAVCREEPVQQAL